jgi:hypothetical protein
MRASSGTKLLTKALLLRGHQSVHNLIMEDTNVSIIKGKIEQRVAMKHRPCPASSREYRKRKLCKYLMFAGNLKAQLHLCNASTAKAFTAPACYRRRRQTLGRLLITRMMLDSAGLRHQSRNCLLL